MTIKIHQTTHLQITKAQITNLRRHLQIRVIQQILPLPPTIILTNSHHSLHLPKTTIRQSIMVEEGIMAIIGARLEVIMILTGSFKISSWSSKRTWLANSLPLWKWLASFLKACMFDGCTSANNSRLYHKCSNQTSSHSRGSSNCSRSSTSQTQWLTWFKLVLYWAPLASHLVA